jgi:hypothetical protein
MGLLKLRYKFRLLEDIEEMLFGFLFLETDKVLSYQF